MENGGVGLKEWGIGRMGPLLAPGRGVLRARVDGEPGDEAAKFSIVFRLARVQGTYLYKGKTTPLPDARGAAEHRVLQDQHSEGGVRGLPVAAGRRAEA